MEPTDLSRSDNALIEAFTQKVATYCAAKQLWHASEGVLVGFSGGADSTALLRVLLRMGVRVVVAHANFGLRGDESDGDEQHVRAFCRQWNLTLEVAHFDVEHYRQTHPGTSTEMACRNLRYPWFERLREAHGLAVIAVAHHADDNVETAMLNSIRGTGLRGVAGIAPKNGLVVRPLLCTTRAEIEAFLAALGQAYVTDSTNSQPTFARNRVRHHVLPTIEATFPGSTRQLQATVTHLRDNAVLYADLLRYVAPNLATEVHRGVLRFDVRRLAGVATDAGMLLYELVREHGFSRRQSAQAAEIAGANRPESRRFYSATHTLTTHDYFVDLEQQNEPDKVELEVAFDDDLVLKDLLEVTYCHQPFTPALCNGRTVVALDSKVASSGRVVLRHPQRGDRLKPFGMAGSRLVSDILADAHLTPSQKQRVWLLEADGTVLWVLGHRAGRHFAVPANSTNYYLLSYHEQ